MCIRDRLIASTTMLTAGGRIFFISLIRSFSWVFARLISIFQSKYASMVQLPRLVLLLTDVMPFTLFIAISSGLVTVIIILSTGCSPLSAIMVILGNVTSGKSDVCILM